MSPCLNWYYEIHGDNAEALASTSFAINEFKAAGAPGIFTTDEQKGTFALLVDQLGWFEFRSGNVERAMDLFTESMAITECMAEPDHEVLYYLHVNWGYMTLITGGLETSRRRTETSLEHARFLKGQWYAAISISILGIIEFQRGYLNAAHQQLNNSLLLWREVGELRGLVFCILYLAAVELALGDNEAVESLVHESNLVASQKLDRWALAFGMDLLGNVALARRDITTAVAHFQQSLVLAQEIGDSLAATLALMHLGDAQHALGNHIEAQHLFRKAYENARQAHWISTILEALIAFLGTEDDAFAERNLVITLAVLSNSTLTHTVRQRAERLRDRLAATLSPQQVASAQNKASEKSAEQWAGEFFQDNHAETLPHAASFWGMEVNSI